MAKLQTESITITLSQLIKNTEDSSSLVTDDLLASLEAVIAELVGASIMVEIE